MNRIVWEDVKKYTTFDLIKKCKRCKKPKPLEEYHKNCDHRDGRLNICKECAGLRKRNTKHLWRNWVNNNRKKVRTRQNLKNAIRRGKVKKKDTCDVCQKKFKLPQIDGHHKDYNEPFKVMWVCRQCHTDLHR